MILGGIGANLGFIKLVHIPVIASVIGEVFTKLIIYKEVSVYLEGLSTAQNRLDQLPPTLVRLVPVKNWSPNSGRILSTNF